MNGKEPLAKGQARPEVKVLAYGVESSDNLESTKLVECFLFYDTRSFRVYVTGIECDNVYFFLDGIRMGDANWPSTRAFPG